MKKLNFLSLVAVLFPLLCHGCGYTQKAVLPRDIKTIYIETVKNKIPVNEMYAYQPGLEIMITNAIIRRIQQDGNLKIVTRDEADAILDVDLYRYDQEGLRFNSLESVEEYRLIIVVGAKLIDAKKKEVLWEEPSFNGDAEYFVSGVRSIAREEAAKRASDKLAYNLVDLITEDW